MAAPLYVKLAKLHCPLLDGQNAMQVWRGIVFSDRAAWMNGPMKFRCLRTQVCGLFAMLVAAGLATASMAQPDAAADRQHMVEEIGAMIAATAGSPLLLPAPLRHVLASDRDRPVARRSR